MNRRTQLLCAGLLCLAGCGGPTEAKKTAEPTPAATPLVRTSVVEAFEAPPSLSSTAGFAALEAAELAPETEGVVREVFVRVGDAVSAGQPLLRLESKEAQWRLAEAKARVSEMQAAVRQAEARLGPDGQRNLDMSADVLNAQSAVDTAEEDARLAGIEADRAARLRETKDISQSSDDRAKSALLGAQARLRGARQQLAAARNAARQSAQGIDVARAQLDSAQAQAEQAQKRLSDTVLRAPFAGTITARTISVGEFAGPQSKPLKLEKIHPLKLVFQLPEASAALVKAGLDVEARVPARPGELFHGKLRAPSGAVDAASRALTVEAEFANPNGRLKPGYFADARILLGGVEPYLRLPAAALDFDPRTETYRVWSYNSGKVKLHLVGLPRKQGATAAISSAQAAGLTGGASVILDAPSNLYDGMAVTLAAQVSKASPAASPAKEEK
jgi:RND family efflux transporter MFP subunit